MKKKEIKELIQGIEPIEFIKKKKKPKRIPIKPLYKRCLCGRRVKFHHRYCPRCWNLKNSK
jgi:hypothetical protein